MLHRTSLYGLPLIPVFALALLVAAVVAGVERWLIVCAASNCWGR